MIGISTSYFAARKFLIYESVRKAYQMGFRLIELGANHDYEENIWTTVKKIKADFPDVLFTIHCYFPPVFKTPLLCNPAEGLTKENKMVLSAIFQAAEIIKPEVVSFHPGSKGHFSFEGEFKIFKGFKKFKSTGIITQEKAFKNLNVFFKQVLKLTKDKYKVCVENIFIATGEQPVIVSRADFDNLFNRFPLLNFLFDYGHAVLSSDNPNQFFLLKKRIIEMHLHDVNYDNLDHRVLGTGKVNLASLFFELKKLKIMPYLILEHSGEATEEEIIKEKELVEKYLQNHLII